MFRRLRRPAAALTAALLLVPALAACGSSDKKDDSASSGSQLDAVTITGDVGKSIKAKWHKKVTKPKSIKAVTLVKGDGEKIATGDTVSTYLWIGDGTTKKDAYSDYDAGKAESIPNNGQLNEVFTKLLKGATYGSRVAVVTPASDLLGTSAGNEQLGIGGTDNLVVVGDLVEKAAVSPNPTDEKVHEIPSGALPKVVEKNGKPTAFDWDGIDKPALTTPVQRAILKKGKGAVVKDTDTVTVNYLGSAYKTDAPFQSSFTGQPLTQPLANLIPGWKIGLVGVKAGSRVLLQIPPALAYGAEGSDGIPANATLWFVIDVIKTGQ